MIKMFDFCKYNFSSYKIVCLRIEFMGVLGQERLQVLGRSSNSGRSLPAGQTKAWKPDATLSSVESMGRVPMRTSENPQVTEHRSLFYNECIAFQISLHLESNGTWYGLTMMRWEWPIRVWRPIVFSLTRPEKLVDHRWTKPNQTCPAGPSPLKSFERDSSSVQVDGPSKSSSEEISTLEKTGTWTSRSHCLTRHTLSSQYISIASFFLVFDVSNPTYKNAKHTSPHDPRSFASGISPELPDLSIVFGSISWP